MDRNPRRNPGRPRIGTPTIQTRTRTLLALADGRPVLIGHADSGRRAGCAHVKLA
nr:MAG TPA: hypothetical protein [Caudoviricetes sp.]